MKCLEEVIQITNDCLFLRTFHSDQGWAYQMKVCASKLKEHKIFQSMSNKGDCLDNSPIEFFCLLKQEIFHDKIHPSFDELKIAIDYYNNKRTEKKLD